MNARPMPSHQDALAHRYAHIRNASLALADGLSPEDCLIQSMPDASPVKWHLAHVTWFFETFVLERAEDAFAPYDARFRVLFNSYYVGVGARQPRAERGLLSRPDLATVMDYRQAIDARMHALLTAQVLADDILDLIELGLHHEQQHQELILTDLQHHFSRNPLQPAYRAAPAGHADTLVAPLRFIDFDATTAHIGHAPDGAAKGFAFDNETPRHAVTLAPYALASRLVSNGEYLAFIADGGYRRPELWLSDGWDLSQRDGWQAPLYWSRDQQRWRHFTLHGLGDVDPAAAVCHVSYYEADAYSRWADARLPTEAEWEHAARSAPDRFTQLADTAWQWTGSAYLPYPGFHPAPGAVGEYNGKFMINQMVLRGASRATPAGHARVSYRNFFPPHARWQFSGIRLAR